MDFVKTLRSVEEFLYEVMTWLLFYPRTLWRSLTHPLAMMDYSDREQGDTPEQQYTDALSPPLFLLLTLLLSHALELSVHQKVQVGASFRGLFQSDQALLMLRCVVFSLFPLMFALAVLRRQGVTADRDNLRAPFFGQCYIAALFAVFAGLGTGIIALGGDIAALAGAALILAGVAWYLAVEILWLRTRLGVGAGRALAIAGWTFFKATVISFAVMAVIVYR